MGNELGARVSLISLGEGAYSVREVCQILQPSMTPRRVHYWLRTGLLGREIRRGGHGRPTLLSYEQLLKVRTLQHLREELGFSLQRVRAALEALLNELFKEDWHNLRFFRSPRGYVAVRSEGALFELPVPQGVLVDPLLPGLNEFVHQTRAAWEAGELEITNYPKIVSNVKVMAGSPVIKGTRIESAFVSHLAQELPIDDLEVMFPHVSREALSQAIDFEAHVAA